MSKSHDYFYQSIFKIDSDHFNSLALEVFQYQYEHCFVYRDYINLLEINPNAIQKIEQIPFIPIGLFKTHKILCEDKIEEIVFESSGTTGINASKHFIADASIYRKSSITHFLSIFGDVTDLVILALLPNYLERGNSSLVYMVNEIMKLSNQKSNGFYLDDFEGLKSQILELEKKGQKIILFGVTYALIDFLTSINTKLHHTTIIETGGMKGRKEEITKNQVFKCLERYIPNQQIYSEYGMTELLSQSYSKSDGRYAPPNWMKILIRDIADPFQISKKGSGLINIIDLANINSCSFIATDDIGLLHEHGKFEVLGRIDQSDLRGCSLLYN